MGLRPVYADGNRAVRKSRHRRSLEKRCSQDSRPVVVHERMGRHERFRGRCPVANSDLLSALSSVETKSATYVAADAVIGSYAALGQNVDVEPVAVLGTVGGYGVAVSASNTDLQKAVSDALATISGNGVANVVCSKWLGSAIDLLPFPS